MKNTTLSYLGGIIDGEGCVNITYIKKRDQYRLKLLIVNTDKRLMNWLKKNFDGYLYKVKRTSNINPKWKTKYEWYFFPKKSTIPLLKSLLPFLICKKEQMLIAIKFLQTIGKPGIKLSRDVYKTRKECKKHLNLLNAKGLRVQRLSEEDVIK